MVHLLHLFTYFLIVFKSLTTCRWIWRSEVKNCDYGSPEDCDLWHRMRRLLQGNAPKFTQGEHSVIHRHCQFWHQASWIHAFHLTSITCPLGILCISPLPTCLPVYSEWMGRWNVPSEQATVDFSYISGTSLLHLFPTCVDCAILLYFDLPLGTSLIKRLIYENSFSLFGLSVL